jgi:hypothetical protein
MTTPENYSPKISNSAKIIDETKSSYQDIMIFNFKNKDFTFPCEF